MSPKFIEVTKSQFCSAYFDPSNVNVITLPNAVVMAEKFRSTMRSDNWPYMETKGYFITKDSIEAIWKQNEEIKGLKIYFGEKLDHGSVYLELIVIGTDVNGNDFAIPAAGTKPTDFPTTVSIADTRPCPIHCGTNNVLNPDQLV